MSKRQPAAKRIQISLGRNTRPGRKARPRPRTTPPDGKAAAKTGGRMDGESAYSAYTRNAARAASLLTKEEELEMGRRMAELAVGHILQRLKVAEEALKRKNRRKYPSAVEPAKSFIAEFNPKGLTGGWLIRRLHGILFNKAAGAEVMLRFIERDAEGAAIIDRFIKSNLLLVASLAHRFSDMSMPLMDRIQEGNIGLKLAVPRFDYRRGLRFSTFAVWWIFHAIKRAIAEKERTVRLPVHLIDLSTRINKVKARLSASNGPSPSREDLAKAAGVTIDRLDKVTIWTRAPVSLDEPIYDEDESEALTDNLAEPVDEDKDDRWDTLVPGKSIELLREAFGILAPIEMDILRQRFGLDGDTEKTLVELGVKYRLSRERIRQLQETALVKLRRRLSGKLRAAV